MTNTEPIPNDEGGEAPCFAHLIDQAPQQADQTRATLLPEFTDSVVIGDADGTLTLLNDVDNVASAVRPPAGRAGTGR